MPDIIVQLHAGHQDGINSGPVRLFPGKTAATVLNVCSRRFLRGLGSLSPKGEPDLLLEDNDVVEGGMTYVFTPSAGSHGMHHIFHVMPLAKSQDLTQNFW